MCIGFHFPCTYSLICGILSIDSKHYGIALIIAAYPRRQPLYLLIASEGTNMVVSLLLLPKILLPVNGGFSGKKVMLVRLLHSPKAPDLILFTLLGMTILVRLLHLLKAYSSMYSTLSDMVTLVRLLHP